MIKLQPLPEKRRSVAREWLNDDLRFHLHWHCYSLTDWAAYLNDPDTHAWLGIFEERPGQAEEVAVITGRQVGSAFHVENWLIRYRWHGRGLEHALLQALWDRLELEELHFAYRNSGCNSLMRQFLEQVLGEPPRPGARLTRARFDSNSNSSSN